MSQNKKKSKVEEKKKQTDEDDDRTSQKEQQVIEFIDNANKLFQNGQYSKAIEYYSKAINHLTSTSNDQIHSNTLSILYRNRAACKQKIGSYKDAVEDCEMSLKFNKDNSVLYKKAFAFELIEKYGKSLHDYESPYVMIDIVYELGGMPLIYYDKYESISKIKMGIEVGAKMLLSKRIKRKRISFT